MLGVNKKEKFPYHVTFKEILWIIYKKITGPDRLIFFWT